MNDGLELIFKKIGNSGKYQWVSVLVLSLISALAYTHNILLPYIDFNPYVKYIDASGREITAILDKEICAKFYPNVVQEDSLSIRSFITDFSLQCNDTAIPLLYFIFYLGGAIGNLIVVNTIDHFGRKLSLILWLVVGIFSNLYLYFNHNLYIAYILYFVNGFIYGVIPNISIVYIIEITNTKIRAVMIAIMVSAPVAYQSLVVVMIKESMSWRLPILIIFIGYFILTIVVYLFMVESPRLFIFKRLFTDFEMACLKIAHYNKKHIQDDIQVAIRNSVNESLSNSHSHSSDSSNNAIKLRELINQEFIGLEKDLEESKLSMIISDKDSNMRDLLLKREYDEYSWKDLLTMKSQRRQFIIFGILFMIVGYVNNTFNQLFLKPKEISKENYYSTILNPIVEMMLIVVIVVMSNILYFGRKKILILLFHFSSIFVLLMSLLDKSMLAASFSKSISLCIRTLLQYYSNELFPTVVRSKAFGIHLMLYKFAAMISPFILFSPYIEAHIFGIVLVMNLVGAMLSFYLTETINSKIKEHLSEMLGEKINDEGFS